MTTKAHEHVQALLDFIDASPSPWHAVENMEQQLLGSAFVCLDETAPWRLQAGGRYYVVRDGSSLIAFVLGDKPLSDGGFKIVGAHTDSPGLRIKPNPAQNTAGMARLGVEIYGGPILATFTDRDLSLAGRIAYRDASGISSCLVKFEQPLLRLPNLAIHLNRNVNEDGLKLHKQNELPLLLANLTEEQIPKAYFLNLLEKAANVAQEHMLGWELNVYDTQKGAFWGSEQAFYADSQLDNLASCHAGLTALTDGGAWQSGNTLMCAFFDHEEIGSQSFKGAEGSFLSDVLQRITVSLAMNEEDYRRSLARSFMVSADMAHAFQPNFPAAYEPQHQVLVNKGPVIKLNANLRYASESLSQAMFAGWCEEAEVPYQKYAHRCDMPCGSTIGPITSARLGIRSVDVGCPMWAMHSLRESAGVLDHGYMIQALRRFFCA
ncbi:MAG: M18 family aminopeptidase [Gammaproteobacteria bacterium]